MSNIQQYRSRLSVMCYDDRPFGLADLSDTGGYSRSEFGEWLYVFCEL